MYIPSGAAITQFLRETKNSQISPELIQLYFPRPYTDEILANSSNIDPVLVFALIRQESAFEPLARSKADARGLMQVLPSTARKFIGSNGDLYEPTANVKAGVGHLRDLLKKYNGRVEHVLAAYNAGARHVEKWKGRFPLANILLFSDLIPFKETRTYVSIIQRNAYWYGRFLVLSNDETAKTVIKKAALAKAAARKSSAKKAPAKKAAAKKKAPAKKK